MSDHKRGYGRFDKTRRPIFPGDVIVQLYRGSTCLLLVTESGRSVFGHPAYASHNPHNTNMGLNVYINLNIRRVVKNPIESVVITASDVGKAVLQRYKEMVINGRAT